MLDYSVINPYIRSATNSIIHKGIRGARRIIFDYELLYIADGELLLNYNEISYRCKKGQFLLLHPGIPHRFFVDKTDLSQPNIHFDITHMPDSRQVPVCYRDLPALSEEEKSHIRKDILEKNPQTPHISFSDSEAALRLFYAVVDHPKPYSLSQKGAMVQLLDMLIADNFPEVFKDDADELSCIEKQVKEYLDAGQGMTADLDAIAKQFNYSKCHLAHRFKARYGVSPMAYRNDKRMQLAKTALQTESVSDVAKKLGFSSIYVFSRAFKNHFGCSPVAYKKAR